MSETQLIAVFIFIFGAIMGSFLNVCIVRLPKEESVVKPASHCRHCKKSISWYDNIPLISYILLKGRCRYCKNIISPRYFVVEALTASLFLYFYFQFGLSKELFVYLIFISGLIVATFVDFEYRIIPDEISVVGIFVGLILSALVPQIQNTSSYEIALGRSALGFLVGGGSILLMGVLGDFIFKKESMGGGDVKLMAMMGSFLGWKLILLTFFLAPFFGAVFGVVEKIRTKDSTIPYGPFLSLGALISLFWGDSIIHLVLRGPYF